MKNRIFQSLRLLVCLVLICALVINISPIKAHATGLVEGIAVAPLPVSVKVVAAAALICLGIMALSESNAFDNAVDNFANFLSETTSYVVDGMVNVFGVVGPDGLVRSYLPVELLESGLYWAFDTGLVSPAPYEVVVDWYTFTSREPINTLTMQMKFTTDNYYHFVAVYSSGGLSVTPTGIAASTFVVDGIEYTCRIANLGNGYPYDASLPVGNTSSVVKAYIETDGFSSYFASDGLTLGRIQAPVEGVAFGDLEAYSGYAGGAISLPGVADDEEELHLPVRIPGLEYNDDVITQTQEEAQTGVTDLEFVFTGDDTVTDGGATNSGTITSGIKDFFDFAPEDLVLPASLTDLFPFCIPKDIYDLVTVFNAEPEAPHFVFDVPFPYMEEPWHIDIDFAVWDSVALVLRRLELLLFVVGLAMATRNYYIRG